MAMMTSRTNGAWLFVVAYYCFFVTTTTTPSESFRLHQQPQHRHHRHRHRQQQHPSRLFESIIGGEVQQPQQLGCSSSTSLGTTSSSNDKEDNICYYQQQRTRLQAALLKMDALVESIQEWTQEEDDLVEVAVGANNNMTAFKDEVSQVQKMVWQDTALPLPPVGLSVNEYTAAVHGFATLPLHARLVYCHALNDINNNDNNTETTTPYYDDANNNDNNNNNIALQQATDFDAIPEIVTDIYIHRAQLTKDRIRTALAKARRTTLIEEKGPMTVNNSKQEQRTTSQSKKKSSIQSLLGGDDDNDDDNLEEVWSDDDDEGLRTEAVVEEFLPRVTRRDDRVATRADLAIAMAACTKHTFQISENAQPIAGGYILRGTNQCKNSTALIAALDRNVPNNWDGQLCYLPDFTPTGIEAGDFGGEQQPILLLLKKDMSPTVNPLLPLFCTGAAVVTAFLFSVGVYGGNDSVMSQLSDGSATSSATVITTSNDDYSSIIAWFNGKVLDVLWPVFWIQAAHEAGHWAVAARDKIKPASVTFYPFWQLPWLGAQTKLKESPPSLTSLFDFAMAGPFLGLTVSALLLVLGLQETATASAETFQSFPALPVSVLKLSTLGGTVVDRFVGGGNGMLLQQDAETGVPLHPFAIAGFTGLMIQAFELLPLGATDGGRLSLSLFGRLGHSAVSGLLWFGLLVACLFGGGGTNLLVGAWIIWNFAQNDPEIPCRDEVTDVDLGRAAAALILWFSAALILIPMG